MSNQWNAWATVTASTEPSPSGIASAVPSSTSTPGTARPSCSRIAATGSTAMISAPDGTSSRVSLPVPAARSQHRRARVRARSYVDDQVDGVGGVRRAGPLVVVGAPLEAHRGLGDDLAGGAARGSSSAPSIVTSSVRRRRPRRHRAPYPGGSGACSRCTATGHDDVGPHRVAGVARVVVVRGEQALGVGTERRTRARRDVDAGRAGRCGLLDDDVVVARPPATRRWRAAAGRGG